MTCPIDLPLQSLGVRFAGKSFRADAHRPRARAGTISPCDYSRSPRASAPATLYGRYSWTPTLRSPRITREERETGALEEILERELLERHSRKDAQTRAGAGVPVGYSDLDVPQQGLPSEYFNAETPRRKVGLESPGPVSIPFASLRLGVSALEEPSHPKCCGHHRRSGQAPSSRTTAAACRSRAAVARVVRRVGTTGLRDRTRRRADSRSAGPRLRPWSSTTAPTSPAAPSC